MLPKPDVMAGKLVLSLLETPVEAVLLRKCHGNAKRSGR